MWRKDLAELVGHATACGLTVALTPSGTAMATRARLEELEAAGLSRVAVSLDGPDPESHDAFRRVKGSYANTMKIIDAVVDLGLPFQINSTVSRLTLPRLPEMAARVATFPLTLWAAFFLVQTGRGASLEQITPEECEEVLRFLDELSRKVPFGIKTTEAPHYRRIPEVAGARVETRFAHLFLKLADRIGRPRGGAVFIPMVLTRQELADLTGTTIETCIRLMSRWGKEGVIETEKDGFVLADRAALEALTLG
jgi:MoaA/NifB/PqqE/SkfB family radical SAM enzyme